MSFGYRLNRKVRIAVCSRFLLDLGGDHRDTIYIAGTGRSGTTWLSDLINYRNQYRQVFEPFHPKGPMGAVFPPDIYVRPGDADPRRLTAARDVLSGRVRGPVIDRFNKRLAASRRVIKDISSNLFLSWLHDQFPGMPVVFIIRHPFEVARSQLRMNWERTLGGMLDQETLVRDHLQPFIEDLRSLKSPFEQYVAMWCIQNYVPFRQLRPRDFHVVFYELLYLRPEQEIAALMAYLGKPFDQRALDAVGVASLMTFPDGGIFKGRVLKDDWRHDLSTAQLRRSLEILEMFGLDSLYGEDPIPEPAGLARLRSQHSPGASAVSGRIG